jgi:hypothetical protein
MSRSYSSSPPSSSMACSGTALPLTTNLCRNRSFRLGLSWLGPHCHLGTLITVAFGLTQLTRC